MTESAEYTHGTPYERYRVPSGSEACKKHAVRAAEGYRNEELAEFLKEVRGEKT